MTQNGEIFYQDEYEQFYIVTWETNKNNIIDITTIIKQPFRWGKPDQGYINNKTLFKLGIISIIRQIIKPLDNGYEIIAEGTSQYEDYIQMNFTCGNGPSDKFKYHLNNPFDDDVENLVSIGSHWTDIENVADDIIWVDLNSDGTSVSTSDTYLSWIDVWA